MTVQSFVVRIRALVSRRRVERELDEELAFHIERETQKYVAAGLSPDEARIRARAGFGPVPLAADECRDVRGISFVEDVARDILYALRTFRRAPLAAATIVATVGLGLGLVAAVFVVYAFFVLRVDAVRNPHELFGVWMELPTGPESDAEASFTLADYEALRRETSVFTDVVAIRNTAARFEGRITGAALVSGNFFQVLGAQPALGRALIPADDQPFAGQRVIVLSDDGWRKLFSSDPAVIGRQLTIDRTPYEVVGVMPEDFRGLGIRPPDYWAPMALGDEFGEYAGASGDTERIEIVGRLKTGLSQQAAAGALDAWAARRPEFDRVPGREPDVWLDNRDGTLPLEGGESLVVFSPLFFAFGLILLIGCANVANLLLARGVSRQREIGIRLALGASRRRIIRQLITESLLLALAAAACGLAISWLVVNGLLYVFLNTLPADFAPLVSLLNVTTPGSDWRVVIFLVAGAVVSTMFFGVAPALQATRLELVPTMRGEVTRNAKPRRARHALIGLQVGASALLMICAAVFLRGALASATRDPGMRTVDTVRVSVENETRRPGVLQELRTHPLVAIVAAASPTRRGVMTAPASGISAAAEQRGASFDYFDVLGFELVSGRVFTPSERTLDAGVAVVSDTLARQLWPNGNGVGQTIDLEEPARTLTVVGVVRAVSGSPRAYSSHNAERIVYVPTDAETAGNELLLRVRGAPERVRQALLEQLTGLDPAFGVMTLRAMTSMQTYLLQGAFWVTVGLGGLALVLTLSGLFSVLSYVVEQQAREIGVRMALGAATRSVVRLVLLQSLRPVGIGLAAGGGLAAAVAIVLVSTPIASDIGDTVNVLDPVAYAASLTVIVTSSLLAVAVPVLRATRIDPIATLRNE
jgi:predicted permease